MKTRGLFIILTFWCQYLFTQTGPETWQWAKQAGGGGRDWGNDISLSPTGETYITGHFEGTSMFDSSTVIAMGFWDLFLAKYGCEGELEWVKTIGNPFGALTDGNGLANDNEGNIFLTGSFGNSIIIDATVLASNGQSDVLIAKFDPGGNLIWADHLGGSQGDFGEDIQVDLAGNVWITGSFSDTVSIGTTTLASSGQTDIFVAKWDKNGNFLWAKQAGGSNFDIGRGIDVDKSGNGWVTGEFNGPATADTVTLSGIGNRDIFLAKYDSLGNLLWAEEAGGLQEDRGYDIATDNQENAYITGCLTGLTIWGDTMYPAAFLNDNIFVAKYDPFGNLVWMRQTGGKDWDRGEGISMGTDNEIYMTGHFADTAFFDTDTLVSSIYFDIFVIKYDSLGQMIWATQAGGPASGPNSTETGSGIAADNSGNAYVTGYFGGDAYFGIDTFTSRGNWDIFVSKYGKPDVKPSVNLLDSLIICAGDMIEDVAILISDEFPESVLISVSSSDTTILPQSGIQLSGTGDHQQWLTLSPNPNQYGLVEVQVSLTDNCGGSNLDTLTLALSPPLNFTAQTTLDPNNPGNYQIEITASGGTPPYYYSLDGGISDTTAIFPNLPKDQYLITVKDELGCIADSLVSVRLEEDLHLDRQIEIYPNPSQGIFSMKWVSPNQGLTFLKIWDIHGRCISSESFFVQQSSVWEGSWNFSHFVPGVYLVQVLSPESSCIKKVMIQGTK